LKILAGKAGEAETIAPAAVLVISKPEEAIAEKIIFQDLAGCLFR
jgi:hypothetical protein